MNDINTVTPTLSNKELADKISGLIDLHAATVNCLNAGAMTPDEGAALTVTMHAGDILADLLNYFCEQADADTTAILDTANEADK